MVGAGLEGGGGRGDKRAWKCSNRESGFCRTQSGRLGRGPRQAAWNPAESWSSSICRSSCTARVALAALWAALLACCKACLAARCSGLPGRVAWRACRSWLSPNCSATSCGMSVAAGAAAPACPACPGSFRRLWTPARPSAASCVTGWSRRARRVREAACNWLCMPAAAAFKALSSQPDALLPACTATTYAPSYRHTLTA